MKFLIFVFSLIIFHPLVLANSVSASYFGELGDLGEIIVKGDSQEVKELLETRGNPRDHSLLNAITEGVTPIAKLLIEKHTNLDIPHKFGWTFLQIAIIYKRPEIVRLLIAHGANLNTQDQRGLTPLQQAIIAKQSVIVRFLIKAGINLNIQDNMGDTPLHFAIKGNQPETIRLLIEYGAKLDIKDRDGRTPLQLAKKLKDTKLVQLIEDSKKGTCKGTFK